MAKRKKKVEENNKEKQEVKSEIRKPAMINFESFCQIKKIPMYHRAGMSRFKDALKLKMSLNEWEAFFNNY